MLLSDFTREVMAYRRGVRDLRRRGFIEVSESGDPLWRFQRGGWYGRKITDVAIGPDGKTLYIKVGERDAAE